MPTREEREALIRVTERLIADFGDVPDPRMRLESRPLSEEGKMYGTLSLEDEALVLDLRFRLSELAARAGTGGEPEGRSEAVLDALDGAEMVMRGELAEGMGRLPILMPSLVFLVVAPVVGKDQAIDLSQRAERLLVEALED